MTKFVTYEPVPAEVAARVAKIFQDSGVAVYEYVQKYSGIPLPGTSQKVEVQVSFNASVEQYDKLVKLLVASNISSSFEGIPK